MVDLSGVTPLEITNSPLPRSCQPAVYPQLEVALHTHLPFPHCNCIHLEWMHYFTTSGTSDVQLLCWIQRIQFHCSNPPHLALTIFLLPLLKWSLSLEGKNMIQTAHVELSTPQPLILYTPTRCGSQSWLLSPAISFSDEGWEMLHSMGIGIRH